MALINSSLVRGRCPLCGTAHATCGGPEPLKYRPVGADMDTKTYTADRDLYTDRDGNLVAEDSPDRAFRLARAGQSVPHADAERLGLYDLAPVEETDEADAKAEDAPAETKAVTKAPAKKAKGKK